MIAVLLAGIFLTSTNGSTAEVKMGIYGSFSGPVASLTVAQKKVAQLLADEWNASGGIMGMQVKLVIEDDQGNPAQSVSVIQKFIDRDRSPSLWAGS
jgi:branched-chain amino acid transport system substrate-binding protein